MFSSVQDGGSYPEIQIMFNILKTQKIMMSSKPSVLVVLNVTIFTEYSKFL